MLKESVKMSWQNICGNKLRSFLTILGIIIGVSAIIALITIVQAVSADMYSQFAQLGAGKLSVSISGTPQKRGLRASDLADLAAVPGVKSVSPSIPFSGSAVHQGQMIDKIAVEGKSEAYFQGQGDLLVRGRALNVVDVRQHSYVCVIDRTLQQKLFFGQDAVGRSLRLAGRSFTVVGVLADDSKDMFASMNRLYASDDGKALIPYTTAQRMAGTGSVTSLELSAANAAQTAQVEERVRTVLGRAFNYHDGSYRIVNMEGLLQTMERMTGMMATMLGGIAGIALLVGGIGIMNMMLVSVTERTAEIGLRKALGALPGDIQLQFLLESVFLSLLGGVLGAGCGLGLSAAGCAMAGVAFRVSWPAIWLGVGFSALVGIAFGWAPARKASRLHPIDALRSL